MEEEQSNNLNRGGTVFKLFMWIKVKWELEAFAITVSRGAQASNNETSDVQQFLC